MLTLLVINGYAAAIVGRLRSLPLTFAGGLALGLIEAYVIWQAPSGVVSQVHIALPIIFLFTMLLVSPEARLRVGRAAARRPLRVPSLRRSVAMAAGFVAVAAVVSTLLSNRDLYTVSKGLVLALIMLSLVLLTGYGGQISLCQLTFVGIGAFAMGKVGGGDSVLGLVAAAGLTGAVGAVVALPALRLRGLYLALATFAFAQLTTALFFNNNDVFGQGGALRVGRIQLPGISLRERAVVLRVLCGRVRGDGGGRAGGAAGVVRATAGRDVRQPRRLHDARAEPHDDEAHSVRRVGGAGGGGGRAVRRAPGLGRHQRLPGAAAASCCCCWRCCGASTRSWACCSPACSSPRSRRCRPTSRSCATCST